MNSPLLDLIRSFAVLIVLLSHLPGTQEYADTLFGSGNYHVQAAGLLGVGIFFTHTCLVLMASLKRQTERDGFSHFAIRFYIRRLFRIYPLSIVVVLAVASSGMTHVGDRVDDSALISNLLLIQNVTGCSSSPETLWSLPFEVQMYVVLPFIYLLVADKKPSASVLTALMLWGLAVGCVLIAWNLGIDYTIIKFVPAFLPGVLAYTLAHRVKALPSWTVVIYLLAMLLAFPILVAKGFKENMLLWPICMALGSLIGFSREVRSPIFTTVFGVIARYSYGIYLIHVPMIQFAFGRHRDIGQIGASAIFIMGLSALVFAAFHVVENPAIRWGRRLSDFSERRLRSQNQC